jgi:hypothetical protein
MESLDQLLENIRAHHTIEEQPFRSRIPIFGRIIAWLRTQWNNVATRWYVLSLVHQQNEINRWWLEAFEKQTQIYQTHLETLERDQISVMEHLVELNYRLTQVEEKLEHLKRE